MPPAPPTFLRHRLTHPVAVLGGGVSGQGVLALLAGLGSTGVVYDAKHGADFSRQAVAAHGHTLVVYSPGFAPEHPWLTLAREAACECLAELDFASLFWRGALVAVTGTNGKTTLTEFLTHALRSVGHDAHATGNIGHAFSQLVADNDAGTLATEDKIAVCEVSSFQAEALRHFRADATLWTNFAEDHLERHPTLPAYFAAKANLAPRSAQFYAGSSVGTFARAHIIRIPGANWIPTLAQPADPRLAGTVFADYPQRENFILAAVWWREAGLASAALYAAAQSFQLGRHRLTRVLEHDGVVFWNDSKATNFHAVEAALAGFKAPVLLIAGGKAKGGDLAGFARRLAPLVKHACLIGETGPALAAELAATGAPHTLCGTLAEALHCATALARPGDQVLLSPGFASFDQFRGYEDRGDQFEQLVRGLTAADPA